MNEGQKYDEGKCRLDLLPVDALWEVGKVYTMGATKYDDWNWSKGLRYSRVIAALLRHLFKWTSGETFDTMDGQHHLASVVWCGLALLHFDLNKEYTQYDDRHKEWTRPWLDQRHSNLQPSKGLMPLNQVHPSSIVGVVTSTPCTQKDATTVVNLGVNYLNTYDKELR